MAAWWGALPEGAGVQVLWRQTGVPSEGRGWSPTWGWSRRGSVGVWAAEGPGRVVQLPSHSDDPAPGLLRCPASCPSCSVCFWGAQLTLSLALITVHSEEKQEDAVLLYLYKYIRVYLYINIKKKSVPNTWIFQVHGKKTWLKGSQQNGHFFFFSFPELFFYCFSYPLWHMVVKSWPGFFFVLHLLIFVFQVNLSPQMLCGRS